MFYSSKATSLADFLYTWGFLPLSEEEFVQSSHLRIPQKPQVPVISWQLVAFSAPRRKSRKSKSNKYPYFSIYLWLFALVRRRIRSVTASPNSSKAPSPGDFEATCCFFRSVTMWQKEQKQQVCPFSYILVAFCPCHKRNSFSHRIFEFLKSPKYP